MKQVQVQAGRSTRQRDCLQGGGKPPRFSFANQINRCIEAAMFTATSILTKPAAARLAMSAVACVRLSGKLNMPATYLPTIGTDRSGQEVLVG